MKFNQYFIPDYILNFKCQCCGECCKRWGIVFDKQTVEEFKKLAENDEEISVVLNNNLNEDQDGNMYLELIDRGEKVSSENEEEQEVYTDPQVCPLLDEDSLCKIHKRYGEDFLSDTCKIFPRKIFYTERGCEMAVSHACPTAAASLKNRQPVEFYVNPEGFDFPEIHEKYEVIESIDERKNRGKGEYFEVEEMLVDIVQLRGIDIASRVVLCGFVADKLKNHSLQEIRDILEDPGEELKSLLSNPVPDFENMMKLIKQTADRRLALGLTEKDMPLTRLLHAAYMQLQFLDEENISEEKINEFLKGYEKFYRPYIQEVSHVYENYLVNYIFSKNFYKYDYMDAYILMCFYYIFICFFSVCSCLILERKVDEDVVVYVINSMENSLAHHRQYCEDVLDIVKQGEFYNNLLSIVRI